MRRLQIDLGEVLASIVSTTLLVTRRVQLLGGVLAIVLTAVAGEWSLFLIALVMALVGPIALALSMIPGALVGFVGARLLVGPLKHVGFVLVGLSHLLIVSCTVAWTYVNGEVFLGAGVSDGSVLARVARMLWAYEVTTGVLAFMAAKSGDDDHSWPVYMVASVASLVFLTTLFTTRSEAGAVVPLIGLSVFGSLTLTWYVVQRERGAWVRLE